ncbi:endolytic transglycosylase MltG [Rickettsiales bacterium]|nr:endolytic transglycosylase MltG [Rickettsiales bacterium]
MFKTGTKFFIVSFLVLLSSVALFIYKYPVVSRDFRLNIKPGYGNIKVQKEIQKLHVVKYRKLFDLSIRSYFKLSKKKYIKGEYHIKKNLSIYGIINQLTKVALHKIFVAEGLTIYQIMEIIKADPYTVGDIDVDVEEGELMPDTYIVANGDSKNSVVLHMQKCMKSFIAEEWKRRDKTVFLKNSKEALILASVIQKEASGDEQSMVAGVFMNRLHKRIRLSSCSSVIYCISEYGKKKFNRRLSLKQLHTDCPQNTYRKYGLPSTAISCPGRDAILATLHPVHTKNLYFVSNGNGKHIFSNNFELHKKQKQIYNNRKKTCQDTK